MVLQLSTRIIHGSVLALQKRQRPIDAIPESDHLGSQPFYELEGTGLLVFPGWILEEGMKKVIFNYSKDCVGKQKFNSFCFSPGIIPT